MANLKDIVSYLMIFSGIACTMSIFISLAKLLLNSEESPVYIKRIKNSLIALVLVLTIVNIVNVTQRYFSSISSDSDFGIGKIPTDIELATIDDTFKDSSKDKDGREVVFVKGYKMVVINTKTLYVGKWENGSFPVGTLSNNQLISGYALENDYYATNLTVDELVPFTDGQGFWGGLTSEIKALRLHFSIYDNNKDKDVDEYTKPFKENGYSANADFFIINKLDPDKELYTETIYRLVEKYGLKAYDISILGHP